MRTSKKNGTVHSDVPSRRFTAGQKGESNQAKYRSGRSRLVAGKSSPRKPDLLAAAAIVLTDSPWTMSEEELARYIYKLGAWSSPLDKNATLELCALIDRDIAERGERSLFTRVAGNQYKASTFGEGLRAAAVCEAEAQSRYIVMRENGKTPEQIRGSAEVHEDQLLVELCDDIVAGTRMDPKEPISWASNKERATETFLWMLNLMEKARICEMREKFLEVSLSKIFELAQEPHTKNESAKETMRNVIGLHRERSVV